MNKRAAAKRRSKGKQTVLSPAALARRNARIAYLYSVKRLKLREIAPKVGLSVQGVSRVTRQLKIKGGPGLAREELREAIVPLLENGYSIPGAAHKLNKKGWDVSPDNVRQQYENLDRVTRQRIKRKLREAREDAENAKIAFLTAENIIARKGEKIPHVDVLKGKTRYYRERHGVQPKCVTFLRVNLEDAEARITEYNFLGIDWYSTAEHQEMVANKPQRIVRNFHLLKPIELDPSLHYMFKFDLDKAFERFKEPKYADLREAIRTGDMAPLEQYVENLAIQKGTKTQGYQPVPRTSQLYKELVSEARTILKETMTKIGNPKADPIAALIVLSRTVFIPAKKLTLADIMVREGQRENPRRAAVAVR